MAISYPQREPPLRGRSERVRVDRAHMPLDRTDAALRYGVTDEDEGQIRLKMI